MRTAPFPRRAIPEAVRAHLRKQQADSDAFQAIGDDESDWRNYLR